ncbi:sugar phosphate isomerase/epimerase [Aquibacillus koreensis]|uniref:Sugar phosphate isomerase/epimerase n=1 Tax=Aquibacillus koreensis TaxID=279446 RepID=A0A9X3WIJ1_9BACI|nr:sugar phosphate isomerase/epimerase [Aquibacillus koreensis]MCT2534796.1 sugar phosphate isomerase/epimerase [Aquibacillus koreensis]MDC3419593.1 sugar phosphate isomerase/epimerase [Aquibacillus koreensis]
MKFAFSRPTASDKERDELFGHYETIGYDGLQLKHAQYAPFIKDPEKFNALWGEHKGIASGLIFGGKLDNQNQQDLKDLMRFSKAIGTERILYCHGIPRDQVSQDDIKHYAKVLSELGQESKEKYGVVLSLHHHFDQPVMYREDFDIFFDNANDSVKLTIDTAHLYKSGINDIAEVITSFRSKIDNFHMKDFAAGDWKVLGQGEIDFGPIFKAISDIEFSGWMSADEESGGTILGGMKECLTHMKKGVEQFSYK